MRGALHSVKLPEKRRGFLRRIYICPTIPFKSPVEGLNQKKAE